jgi:hypothetical protein
MKFDIPICAALFAAGLFTALLLFSAAPIDISAGARAAIIHAAGVK